MELFLGLLGLAEQAALVFAGFVLVNLLPLRSQRLSRALLALVFVGALLMSMHSAVELGHGVIGDLRGALLVLSVLIGGYLVGGVTLLAAELYRLDIGGAGLSAGLIGNAMATLVGAGVLFWTRRRGEAVGLRHITTAALGVTATTNLAFLFIQPVETALTVWRVSAAPISLINFGATVLVGALLVFDRSIKRADRMARRQRDYLDRILNTGAEAVAVIAPGGRFEFFNQAACDMLGVSAEQLGASAGENRPWRISDLEGRPMAIADAPVARVVRTRRPERDAKLRVTRPDGTTAVLSLNVRPMLESDRVVCAMRDITREHRLAEETERQKNRLDFVIRSAGVGVWDWRPRTGEVALNPRWAEIVGYRLEELEPVSIDTWRTLCHPDDLARADAAMRAAFSARRDLYHCDVRMRHKDGHWVWVRDTGRVSEWGADGEPERVVGTHIDITELKAANEQLASVSRKYESTIAAAPDGILTLNADSLVDSFNPAAQRLFGWRADEIVGQPIDRLLPADLRAKHAGLSAAFVQQGPAHPHGMADWRVVRGLHKSGRTVPLMVTLSRTIDGGRPVVIAIIRDMSGIEDQRQKLEALTDRLIIKLREVEQASAAKSSFLAAMSHELRTPLNAILGFADLMRSDIGRDIDPDRRAGYLDDIHRSGEHLLSLINDILDLSKIEAGKVAIAVEPIAPREVVKEALRTMLVETGRRRVSVRFRAPDDLPPVLADRRALLQILLNLLSNAAKFAPATAGRITVRAERCGAEAVRFSVADNGPGIPADKLKLLGEPFTQAGDPLKAGAGGTGLGLAISKRLSERMNGRLEVESRPGEGVRAAVILPTAGRPGEAGTPAASAPARAPEPEGTG
ncbi:MAG: PAS domain S-box protein [Alphaproteobacteria bacterium]|nr:PAS domain S-box protein [Alphaproteobacteria bacterium]